MNHNIYHDLSDKSVFKQTKLEIKSVFLPNVYTKAWQQTCNVIDIKDFDPSTVIPGKENKLSQPGIQCFNYNQRLAKKLPDETTPDWNSWPFWQYWNGLFFVDADTKKYQGHKADKLKWNLIENVIVDYLQLNCTDNFYFEQLSNSGKSFHFVFYVDCDKTYENFLKSAKYFKKLVIEAFSAHGLNDVINWPEVMDEHNDNPIQPLFFSNHPINFCLPDAEQRRSFGNSLFLNDIDILSKEKEDFDYENTQISFDTTNISSDIKNVSEILKISWSHDYRLRLAIALYHIFNGNYDKAYEYYGKIIPYMVQTINNHTERELHSLFRNQFHKLGGYCISRNMLKLVKNIINVSFKVKQQFTPILFSDINYDKVYNLKQNEYLSNVIEDIYDLPGSLIHVNAGCGVGKTYSANTLSEKLNENKLQKLNILSFDDDLFNPNISSKKRICFITPMTSINLDNFPEEKYPNWKIIDGIHFKNKDYIESDYNICTTWDSFIKNKMDESPSFSCFMFDEIHSLYMYDYRTEIISKIKDKIKEISRQNRKVILLTGTPSLEIKEFSDFNPVFVKINKDQIKITTNIIVYNEQYLGYITKDILTWMKQSNQNRIAIFTNNANFDLQEKLKLRGLNIDFLYNKQIKDDVEFARTNHDMRSSGGLFSVYGQAGINLYSKSPIRIYILDKSGINIIQYANRFRNREMVESINIFYKAEQLNANLISHSYPTLDETANKIKKLQSLYTNMFGKNKLLLDIKFGINFEYVDIEDNAYTLNQQRFDAYIKIQKVNDLETQMQMIYHRLITNHFIPKFVYLDEDTPDQWRSKFKGKLAGALQRSSQNFSKFIKYSFKEDKLKLYVDLSEKTNELLAKTLPQSAKENIEYIMNKLLQFENSNPLLKNIDFETKIAHIQTTWNNFIGFCLKRDINSIRKSDIQHFRDVVYIKAHMNELKDGFIIGEIKKKRDSKGNLGTLETCQLAAAYTTVFRNPELSWSDCYKFADETYTNIKNLCHYIDDYKWFFDFDTINQNYEDIKKIITEEKISENQLFLNYLFKIHCRGKIGGKIKANHCSEIKINGVVYKSKTEAMKKLKIGRKKLETLINC